MREIIFFSIFAVCCAFLSCHSSAKNYLVDLVDRSVVFAPDQKPNPLMLVVEIDENGKLSLNKIRTGTIDDLTELSKKLEAVFDDREKTGLVEKEVVIDLQGEVKNEDLEKLIESLAGVKASPIRVIKNNLKKVNP